MPALAVVAGVALWLAPVVEVSTDDAYVKAEKTLVAPEIDAVVRERLVRGNEPVRAGQPLLRLVARARAPGS